MDDVQDIEGLMLFLLHHGEIIEGDKIRFEGGTDKPEDDLEA